MPDRKSWPAWRYGPNGEAEIFAQPDDVPEGWEDTPAAFHAPKEPRKSPSKPPRKVSLKDFGVTREEGVAELRAEGVDVADDAKAADVAALLLETFGLPGG